MYTEKDLSIVIPSYNNLEYLKLLYTSIRQASKDVELIFYADGCTDGTGDYIMNLLDADGNVQSYIQKERVGHTYLYDWGFNKAKRDVIGILHADMVVHKDFFKNILKHLNNNTIVCGTCVEPPLHPPGYEKHILDAGMYPHMFSQQRFDDFCDNRDVDVTQDSIFAPWFVVKEDYFNSVGGHDSIFAPYGYEDCDIFARMAMAGMTFIQSRDAFVYHFTQRGHKWTKGVHIENEDYQYQMNHTRKEYIRKFGTNPLFDEYHSPTPAHKYDIGIVLSNLNEGVLHAIEPHFSTLYIDTDLEFVQRYLDKEKSFVDIRNKIKSLTDTKDNDILVDYTAPQMTQQDFQLLTQLPQIIQQQGEVGQFELYNNIKLTINRLQNETIRVQEPRSYQTD